MGVRGQNGTEKNRQKSSVSVAQCESGVCSYITILHLSYHIAGKLSFSPKQLKVQASKLTLLYFLAPGAAVWEICFAVSWS